MAEENANIIPYPKIRQDLSTFTIINCEHKRLFWRLIGHTAVVYYCHETNQLMVLESHRGVGVTLTPMGKWVSEYPGKVFVRIPTFDFLTVGHPTYITDFDEKIQIKAEEFIKKYLGSSYPNLQTWSGKMKLVLAALDLKICRKDLFTYSGDDVGIFCTMLVIMLLQYCGLVSMGTDAEEWEPDDTRKDFTLRQVLTNCKYGNEIQIK